MKIKPMPILVGAFAVAVVATPLAIKAQTILSGKPLVAQADHHSPWDQLNLSDQQKTQLKQIQDDTRTQMEAVLTADQQAKLKAAMQQHRQDQGQGQNHQRRQDSMASLNLSDEQKAKMKEIMQAQKTRMDAVFTPEQKQQMHQQWQQQHQQDAQ
jgi:periplasmic protein CpxP/Spy